MRPPIYLPDADLFRDITISPLIVLVFLFILGAVLTLLPVLLVIATAADIVFFFSPKTKTLYEKHLQEFNDHVETTLATFYEFESPLDQKPCVAILTLKSGNRKTGNMAQVWIPCARMLTPSPQSLPVMITHLRRLSRIVRIATASDPVM